MASVPHVMAGFVPAMTEKDITAQEWAITVHPPADRKPPPSRQAADARHREIVLSQQEHGCEVRSVIVKSYNQAGSRRATVRQYSSFGRQSEQRAFRMRSEAMLLTLIAVFLGAAGQVRAATVTIQFSNFINFSGEIGADSPEKFSAVLSGAGDACLVTLDSSGGDVMASLEIGRMLRARSCKTMVAGNLICASACVFIQAAGVDREAYGRIGIHRPRFDDAYFSGLSASQAREKYQRLEDETRGYLREMGMPDDLFTRMMRVPSSGIQWLTSAEVSRLGLVGTDPAYEEWLRARYVQQFGSPDAYRRHIDGLHLEEQCIYTVNGKPFENQNCINDIERRYPEASWSPSTR